MFVVSEGQIMMVQHRVGLKFRDLPPKILTGMASDRYAGWIDQIYSDGRYKGRLPTDPIL